MRNANTVVLCAFLTERDVVVTDITLEADGSYEIRAQGARVNVGAPGTPDDLHAWAHGASEAVVTRLGNRLLPG
jgi:hypothetical protein